MLQALSELPDADFKEENLQKLFEPYDQDELPEVTLFLSDWVEFCPPGAKSKVLESTKEMAEPWRNGFRRTGEYMIKEN